VVVRTAPADVGADQVESLLLAIFDAIRGGAKSISLETLRSQISATIACHAAIKVHTPLDREKMNWLVRELGRTECPMTCPHGRPILLKHSLKEIQKAFKRL
jgi:DNA mismatch repair protein MutL